MRAAAQQLAQFRHREAMAGVNTDQVLLLRPTLVDLRLELLREVLQLRPQARSTSARPDQLFAKGVTVSAPLLPLDQRREESAISRSDSNQLPVGKPGTGGRRRDFPVGTDVVEKVEHHEHRLFLLLVRKRQRGSISSISSPRRGRGQAACRLLCTFVHNNRE